MTSDAKIGLLLGLVFIFIIAFIINGLPTFRAGGDKDNSEMTVRMANSHKETIGIPRNQVDAIGPGPVGWQPPAGGDVTGPPWPNPNTQYNMYGAVPPPADGQGTRYTVDTPPGPSVEEPKTEQMFIGHNAPAPAQQKRVEAIRDGLPRKYVVGEGENLSVIAKKFYGQQEGNRLVNIERIYKANRNVIKSLHEVHAGQEIIIPPLQTAGRVQKRVQDVLPKRLVEPAKSVGQRRIAAKPPKVMAAKEYVVREDDNLWRIAAEHLGDGNRYKEIVRLNAGILENENTVIPGMRLRLPLR